MNLLIVPASKLSSILYYLYLQHLDTIFVITYQIPSPGFTKSI